MPWAAVVRLDVVRRCARVDGGGVLVASAHARRSERVRVLNRALRLDSVIAAVKRQNPQLLQPPHDPAHGQDLSRLWNPVAVAWASVRECHPTRAR